MTPDDLEKKKLYLLAKKVYTQLLINITHGIEAGDEQAAVNYQILEETWLDLTRQLKEKSWNI